MKKRSIAHTDELTIPASLLDAGDPEHVKVVKPEIDPRRAAYQAALDADNAWQAELERLFGRKAGDVRYTKEGRTGPTLEPLHAEFQRAGDAWRAIRSTPIDPPPPNLSESTLDEIAAGLDGDALVELAIATSSTPLPNEERLGHRVDARVVFEDERTFEAIRIGALALLEDGWDYCTVCGLPHRPTQCPQIHARLMEDTDIPTELPIMRAAYRTAVRDGHHTNAESLVAHAMCEAEQYVRGGVDVCDCWTCKQDRSAPVASPVQGETISLPTIIGDCSACHTTQRLHSDGVNWMCIDREECKGRAACREVGGEENYEGLVDYYGVQLARQL